MSRIGRLPIAVPAGVDVTIDGRSVTVQGPRGTLHRDLHPDMLVAREGDSIVVTRPSEEKVHKQLHGLTRTLVANMVIGVTTATARASRSPASAIARPRSATTCSSTWATATRSRSRRRPASASRWRTPPGWPSWASTRSSSARSPHGSARPASPSRTRARASATPASRSAARPARPARSAARSDHEGTGTMTGVANRGTARQKRHERIRLTLAGTSDRPRLAVFRSLNHIYAQVIDDSFRPDARRRLHGREGASRLQADQDGGGQGRRAPRRRAGQDRRRRARRLRSGRVPVSRADQVARRGGPRSRPGFLIG